VSAFVSEAAIRNHAAFIWSVADLLRGDYKQSEYGRVILPLVVIRRLDCVLEPTKAKVLEARERHGDREPILCGAAGQPFYNTSKVDARELLDDPQHVAGNLRGYLAGFSAAARSIDDEAEVEKYIAGRWGRA
jgi:type I restriction enzyme M protein